MSAPFFVSEERFFFPVERTVGPLLGIQARRLRSETAD
jgi:hypothetical protein